MLAKPLDTNGIVARLTDAPGLGVEPREDIVKEFK